MNLILSLNSQRILFLELCQRHPFSCGRDIADRSNGEIPRGGVFACIENLEKSGLITTEMDDTEPRQFPKRRALITKEGILALDLCKRIIAKKQSLKV